MLNNNLSSFQPFLLENNHYSSPPPHTYTSFPIRDKPKGPKGPKVPSLIGLRKADFADFFVKLNY